MVRTNKAERAAIARLYRRTLENTPERKPDIRGYRAFRKTVNRGYELELLKHHVTGAIERGEAVPIVEKKLNGYKAFYGMKRADIYAATSFEAWKLAVAEFKVSKKLAHRVSVVICEKDGKTVTHSTAEFG